MGRTWSFGDVELVALWTADKRRESLPHPLTFLSNTPMLDDYERELSDIRERMRDVMDDGFGAVLDVLARPDVRIRVEGFDGRDPDDPRARVRLYAALTAKHCYLIRQRPGATIWHSGGYVITEHEAPSLSRAVCAELPEMPAGRMDPVLMLHAIDDELPGVANQDMDYSGGRSAVSVDAQDSVEDREAAFMRAPATYLGTIEIAQGHSIYGPRGITSRWVAWRDLEDDGRYAIAVTARPLAVPVDRTRMIAMIDSAIADVLESADRESSPGHSIQLDDLSSEAI
ncbi:ESX secretion-associated protein EspG [Nocardia sp. NPDC127526]|uniref:ESX secretion-associated protein EspG n=1 Tax=Nocardia sp. NPDC127526 TaxID=3345393 RepID=UPI0036432FD9